MLFDLANQVFKATHQGRIVHLRGPFTRQNHNIIAHQTPLMAAEHLTGNALDAVATMGLAHLLAGNRQSHARYGQPIGTNKQCPVAIGKFTRISEHPAKLSRLE